MATKKNVILGIVDDDLFGTEGIKLAAKSHPLPEDHCFIIQRSAPTVDTLLHDPREWFHVVILDLYLQDSSNVADNVKKLRARGAQVVILSSQPNKELARQAFAAGAATVCRKQMPPSEVLERAYQIAIEGRIIMDREFATAISGDPQFIDARLSQREKETLRYYSMGYTAREIAEKLIPRIAESTVKTNLRRIREKYEKVGRPGRNRGDLRMRAREDFILMDDELA